VLERRIEIRWRDMDAYGHVNNAVYLNYLEDVRDAWVQEVLGQVSSSTWDFVLARVAIDYRSELTQDDGAIVVRCWLDSIGRSSLRTRETIVKLDGTLSAEAESVVVRAILGPGPRARSPMPSARCSSGSSPRTPEPQTAMRRPRTKWSSYQVPAMRVIVTPPLLLPESRAHPLPMYVSTWSTVPFPSPS